MKFTTKQRLLFFAAIGVVAMLILHIRRTHSFDDVKPENEEALTDSHHQLIQEYLVSVSDINHFGDLQSTHADVELDEFTARKLVADFERTSLSLLEYPRTIPARRFCEEFPGPCDFTGRLSVLRGLVVHAVHAYPEDDHNKPITRGHAVVLQKRYMRELYTEWVAEQLIADRKRRAAVLCQVIKDFPQKHGLKTDHVRRLKCDNNYKNPLGEPVYANF